MPVHIYPRRMKYSRTQVSQKTMREECMQQNVTQAPELILEWNSVIYSTRYKEQGERRSNILTEFIKEDRSAALVIRSNFGREQFSCLRGKLTPVSERCRS